VPWGDPEILEEIIRQSRSIRDPVAARKFRRAAVATGIVESGGKNLRYGDADSVNWRQERAQGYADDWARTGGAYNTKASVARFRNEFLQHYDPGEKAADVAWQVQRPREDLRGRYGQEMDEAIRVLQQARGGARGRPSGAPNGTGALPGTSGPRSVPQGSEGLTALLASLAGEKPQVQTAGLQGPAHSAGAALPQGYQSPASGGGPQQRTDIAGLLSAIATVGGGVERGGMDPMAAPTGGAQLGGGKSGGGRYEIAELFWQGQDGINIKDGKKVPQGFVEGHKDHVHVAAGPRGVVALGKLAQEMGLTVRENPAFDPVDAVHAPNSYHYKNRAIDVSGDPKVMAEYARRVARMRKR
jgi:hypothetical protein